LEESQELSTRRSRAMIIIGCDLHTRTQQIAMLDTETGEVVERRLEHDGGEAKRFYEGLKERALVGIESTGFTRWFAEMLAELGHELVVGDAAKIRAMEPRQQKHDRRDAQHLLNLLVRGDFPRLWCRSNLIGRDTATAAILTSAPFG
jgi:transposase